MRRFRISSLIALIAQLNGICIQVGTGLASELLVMLIGDFIEMKIMEVGKKVVTKLIPIRSD